MQERRRHCHGRTLTDGFRGSVVHKDATIFSPRPSATFHSTIRAAAFDRARSMRRCQPPPDLYLNQKYLRHFNSIEVQCLQHLHSHRLVRLFIVCKDVSLV